MKGYVQWSPVYDGEDFASSGALKLGTARSASQRLTH